jgi:hypothetical protein
MNKAQKKELYENITAHGNNLKNLFKLDNSVDSVKLCKSLFKLENQAQKLALEYCNYGNLDNSAVESILKKAGVLLNITDTNQIFFNGDARGYALKISDNFCKDKEIFKDWGGYGILAPDFREYLTESDSTPQGMDAIDHLMNRELLNAQMDS